MKIFFVTDNRRWFNFLDAWREDRPEKVNIYCSQSGTKIFQKEIESGRIFDINVKSSASRIEEDFDMGFSCHCKQIFPKRLVENIPCFNFHPGFNPYNKGWFPQVFSIINGKPIGATVHRMDEKIDHGPIVAQKEVFISSHDTSKSVYDRVLETEFELFNEWIDRLVTSDYKEIILNSEGNYNSISDFEALCEIDLERVITFKEAVDYFRAMTFDGYDNAFFLDDEGRKVFVSIALKPE